MKRVEIVDTHEFFLRRTELPKPVIPAEGYSARVDMLLGRMGERGVDFAVIYGDREHFANIEYFTGYDPRFEEALFVIDSTGEKHIIVGNEGYAYSFIVPYRINRVLYQNFSLQGQPRERLIPLRDILMGMGIGPGTKVGLAGYKYMETNHEGNPDTAFDVPAYILDAVCSASGRGNVSDFTRELTRLPDGIRMRLRTVNEVRWAEYGNVKTSSLILRMIKNLRPGIGELELSRVSGVEYLPQTAHPMLNFGAEHVGMGLRSPDDRRLELGEVMGVCASARGSLTARYGVAAYDEASYAGELRGLLESFYMPFWRAVASWYGAARIGAPGGALYDSVMGLIGTPDFGVALNPGHNIGGDEWTNSPSFKGSEVPLLSGAHMQADIIASGSTPTRCAICEDGVILADAAMREAIREEDPAMWSRFGERTRMAREYIGLEISDDLLLLSDFNCVYFPFMLNTGKMLALR